MNFRTNTDSEELTREEAVARFGRDHVENGDSEIENNSAVVYWEDIEGNSYRVMVVGDGGKGVRYVLLS